MRFPSMKQGFSLNEKFMLSLVIVFVVQKASLLFFSGYIFEEIFALSMPSLTSGFLWSTFTYAFLHDGPMHLIFNLLLIFFMGRVIERELPSADFIALCTVSAITGGLFWLSSNVFSNSIPGRGLVGASAIALAFLTFVCVTRPNEPMRFLLFLFLPVTLKPKIILYAVLGYELYFLIFEELAAANYDQRVTNMKVAIAHSAHLGGIAAGYIFYLLHKRGFQFPTFKLRTRNSKSSISNSKFNHQNHSPSDFKVNISGHDNMQSEIDRILDKINDKGFGSLTHEEKLLLDKAKSFLNKKN